MNWELEANRVEGSEAGRSFVANSTVKRVEKAQKRLGGLFVGICRALPGGKRCLASFPGTCSRGCHF